MNPAFFYIAALGMERMDPRVVENGLAWREIRARREQGAMGVLVLGLMNDMTPSWIEGRWSGRERKKGL
jgi:hypothetical protein